MQHFKFILLSASALALLFLPSCATTRGFGQDLQKVGGKLENRADATGGAEPSTGINAPSNSSAPSAY